jgi:dihydroorotase
VTGTTNGYLITGVSVLGGEPTDLLLRDGVVAAVGHGLEADGA